VSTDSKDPGASSDDDDDDDDEAGLAAGLAGLANLVADSGTLEELLTQVATFAMLAVSGADGAGVTMLESGQADTIVASSTFVRDIDSIQYRIGEGPCISAAAAGLTAGSGSLGEDESWPAFGPRAAKLGVHSALSLALVLNGEVLGALNMYAYERDAFGQGSRRTGELFAALAAVAVYNARVLDQAQRATAQIQVALTSRSTIDQAIGIIMGRSGLTAEEAFVRLRIVSQRDHIKLAIVAANLVAEAVRGAQARRPPPHE
jgi:GAF domain-containing protein